MKSIVLNLHLFESQQTVAASEAVLEAALRTLTLANNVYLQSHPNTPPLYSGRVRYQSEPFPREDWNDIGWTLQLGHGDCEDLSCWLSSQLQVREGIDAWPDYTSAWDAQRNLWLYHIIVRYPDGRTEDPSRRLGMAA